MKQVAWMLLVTLSLMMFVGCGEDKGVNVIENVIVINDNGDGVVRIPPSPETGNVAITINYADGQISISNKNAETVGVRIANEFSVLLSDGLLGAGESSSEGNINVIRGVEYTLTVRFYEFNVLDILTNIFRLFGEENGWERLDETYIRQEFTATVIFP